MTHSFKSLSVIHCNTLQYTSTHCNTLQHTATQRKRKRKQGASQKSLNMLPSVILNSKWYVRCSVLQHVAVRCIALQCVAVCSNQLTTGCCFAVGCSVRHSVLSSVIPNSKWYLCCSLIAVCCSVLQCVAVCCSGLQCAAVSCSEFECAVPCVLANSRQYCTTLHHIAYFQIVLAIAESQYSGQHSQVARNTDEKGI